MAYIFSNNAVTTLDGTIDDDDTTLTVDDATAFPADGDFTIIVEAEIMLVTGVAGSNFTVARGQEGTAAAAHTAGVGVRHILTADFLNETQIGLGSVMTALGTEYGARARATRSTQTFTTGSTTAVDFTGADDFDTDNFHDPSVNSDRMIIPSGFAGVYLVIGGGSWGASATGNRIMNITVNGTPHSTMGRSTIGGVATNTNFQTVTGIFVVSVADYFGLQGFQTSGGDLNLSASLTIFKLA